MKIKNKLTLQFVIIVVFIMAFSLFVIYFFNENYRKIQFYDRLKVKAQTTAKLLLEVNEIDTTLLNIINKNNLDKLVNEKIIIYNAEGKVIYDSRQDINFAYDKDSILKVIDENEEVKFYSGRYEIYGMKLKESDSKIYAFAGAIDKYGREKLVYLKNIIIITFFISLVVAFFTGLFFANKALQPISSVIEEVKNISAHNLNNRLSEGNGKDEIAKLSRTFNEMLDRLEKSFSLTKMFVANASHEMKTPLTTILGQLELALSKDRDNAYLVEKINSVLIDIKKLIKLVNQLLSLTHISSGNCKLDIKEYRIDEILWNIQNEIANANPGYKVLINFINFPDNEELLKIKCDYNLFKTALFNLVENACKFSKDNIAYVSTNFSDDITISIEDKGIGIDESDLPYIFHPFYRGKNTSGIHGYGIGLSIVEKIMELHHSSIFVKSKIGEGTIFTIKIKNDIVGH